METLESAQQMRGWRPQNERARKEFRASLIFAGGVFLAGMMTGAFILGVIIQYTIL